MDHDFSNFGIPHIPNVIYKDSALKHGRIFVQVVTIYAGFSLRTLFKETYVSTDPYFRGHGVISGVNCLDFTEKNANFRDINVSLR